MPAKDYRLQYKTNVTDTTWTEVAEHHRHRRHNHDDQQCWRGGADFSGFARCLEQGNGIKPRGGNTGHVRRIQNGTQINAIEYFEKGALLKCKDKVAVRDQKGNTPSASWSDSPRIWPH